MIRLALEGAAGAGEQWAFETLVDVARLVPAATGEVPAVRAVRAEAASTAPAVVVAGDGLVRVSARALERILDVAGAGREQRSGIRDRHGRVPSSESAVVQEGSERTVALRILAEALRSAVREAAGPRPVAVVAPWPDGHRWAAAFTHDLDVVTGWPLFAAMRWAELAGKGQLARAARAVASTVQSLPGDPVRQGVEALLALEHRSGVRATWFVLAGRPTLTSWRRGDITYSLESSRARRLLDRIAGGGHELGLHGSFNTRDSAELLAEERARLAAAVGQSPQGLRQHFLRMAPVATLRAAATAGFAYDSTFGFPDRNGFRLGLADIVSVWDAVAGQVVNLQEAPLVWMDRALSKYQGVEDPHKWTDDALELASVCEAAQGLWVGLWHPNVTPALGFPGSLEALDRLISSIVARGPYLAPLGEIVAWRRARRAVRGRVEGDGRMVLTGDDHLGRWKFTLDRSGDAEPGETLLD